MNFEKDPLKNLRLSTPSMSGRLLFVACARMAPISAAPWRVALGGVRWGWRRCDPMAFWPTPAMMSSSRWANGSWRIIPKHVSKSP